MFSWLSSIFTTIAYNAAINSVGHTSHFGIFQPKEPKILQDDEKKYMQEAK